MQILEIVLYNQNGEKRTLSLSLGKVNIITGSSATGKSAIIDIVEYCLGRSDCTVPAGVIRETVSWYGLLVQLSSSQMFIARENPASDRSSTNKVFVEQGTKVQSPDKPPTRSNTTIEAVVTDLTRKIGIEPNLNIPPLDQTRNSLEANFKHALVYCFQQQDEIAQKSTLFHRQSEPWLIQSVKDTLPYFLGAIREDHLILQQKLIRAKMDLRRAEIALREAEQVKGSGISRGRIFLDEAIDVGIFKASEIPEEIDKVMEILKKVQRWTPKEIAFPVSNRLGQLQDEYNNLIIKFNDKSEQIKAAKTFANEAEGFENESNQQKLRLESIGLFENVNKNENCPICSGKLGDNIPTVEAMRESIKQIDKNLKSTARERPRLREYIEKLEKESVEINQKLEEKQEAISSIQEEQEETKRLRDINLRRAKIVGKISFWLNTVKIIDETSTLKDKVDEAKRKVANLENQLDDDGKEDRITSILDIIGRQMSSWSKQLSLEHSGSPVRLDLTNATVVVDREDRPIPLKKMGSGQNWVGYHLIIHFALHQYFTKHNRPIPRFIFLDQPSQVYYPRDKDSEFGGSVDSLDDDDKKALFQMYEFIFEFAKSLTPDFQIIVMDHADLTNKTFRSSIVERWRDGKALIPQDWIQ